jgi:hypothetical protein
MATVKSFLGFTLMVVVALIIANALFGIGKKLPVLGGVVEKVEELAD